MFFYNAFIESNLTDDDKSSIAQITAESAQLADVDLRFDRGANGEKQKAEAGSLSGKANTLNDLNDRCISVSKAIGTGKKGTVGILSKLLAGVTIGTGANMKETRKILELPEISKANDATSMLRALLMALFPSTAEIYETGDMKKEVEYCIEVLSKIYHDAKNANLDSKNKAAISDDGFEEARTQAQEILDQLKSAATKIGQFKANDVNTDNEKDLGAQKNNEKAADDVSTASSKLSSILLEIQTSMQEALTKGMDSGLVLVKTSMNEIEFRLKAIRSLVASRKEIAVGIEPANDKNTSTDIAIKSDKDISKANAEDAR